MVEAGSKEDEKEGPHPRLSGMELQKTNKKSFRV